MVFPKQDNKIYLNLSFGRKKTLLCQTKRLKTLWLNPLFGQAKLLSKIYGMEELCNTKGVNNKNIENQTD